MPGKKPALINQKNWQPFLMVAPFFVLILLFSYVPLWGWSIAFITYNPGQRILDSDFAGLGNFTVLFSLNGREFLRVMRNTVALSLLSIAVTPVPVVFALMINQVKGRAFKRIVQTVSAFPHFISWVIVYSVCFALFSVDDGLLNQILLKLGIIDEGLNPLGSADAVWLFQTCVLLWKQSGYMAIIYLAAITGIDPELYNAAKVDGAGTMRQIMHITLPGIAPTYMVILILSIGNLLSNGFEQFYLFHNPLVHSTIEVLDTYIYRIGLQRYDFSLATAVGLFKTIISVLLLLISNYASKRIVGTSILS